MNYLKRVFEGVKKLNKLLREEKIFGFNGFLWVLLVIIFIGVIGLKIESVIGESLIIFTAFLFTCFICLSLPFSISTDFKIKKYIVWGERKNLIDVFKEFSTYSYIVSIISFSIMLSIPIIGLSCALNLININSVMDWVNSNMTILFFSVIFIESILWFAYHIIYRTVEIQEIKIKVALFSAIAATLLILAELNLYIKNFKLIITYIAGSYFWINFIIELSSIKIKSSE